MLQPPLTRVSSLANTAAKLSRLPTRLTGTRRIARNALRRGGVWVLGHRVVSCLTMGDCQEVLFLGGFEKLVLVGITPPFWARSVLTAMVLSVVWRDVRWGRWLCFCRVRYQNLLLFYTFADIVNDFKPDCAHVANFLILLGGSVSVRLPYGLSLTILE